MKLYEIGSGTKLFITFELKVFRHEERETQSFYADCFYIVSSQPNQRAAPVAHKFVWPRPALSRSEAGTQLTAFSQIPKSPAHASGHEVIHLPGPISYLGILFWHLWMMHPPRVRVNTCAHVCT